jgi:hypothetical protein
VPKRTPVEPDQKWVSNNDPELVITVHGPVVNQIDTWAVTTSVGVQFTITTNEIIQGYRPA